MWETTTWAVVTWLKGSLVLAAVVGVCWLVYGLGSGQFALAAIVAALGELYLLRALAREWGHEASMRWWWNG